MPGGCAIRVNTVSVMYGGDRWGGGGVGHLILSCHHMDSVLYDINPFLALAEGLTGCLIFTL